MNFDDQILEIAKEEDIDCTNWLFTGTVSNTQLIRIVYRAIEAAKAAESTKEE